MKLEFLRHNFGLKVISLALGLSLYVYVQSLETAKTSKSFNVPLEVFVPNPDLVVMDIRDEAGNPVKTVEVTMVGPVDELASLNATDIQKGIRAGIDLSRGSPGDAIYNVQVVVPESVRKYQWDWNRPVSITTEMLARDERIVEVQRSGSTPSGLDFGGATVEPARVLLSGAESRVRRVRTVRVLFGLDKAVSGVASELKVEMLDADQRPVEGVTALPEKVRVTPALTPAAPFVNAFIAPSYSGQLPYGFRIVSVKVEPPTVRLFGALQRLQGVSTISTLPINIDTLTSNTTIEANLVLPRGLRTDRNEPVKVTIQVEAVDPPTNSTSSNRTP